MALPGSLTRSPVPGPTRWPKTRSLHEHVKLIRTARGGELKEWLQANRGKAPELGLTTSEQSISSRSLWDVNRL